MRYIFIFLLLPSFVYSQPHLQWQERYDNINWEDHSYSVAAGLDDTYTLAGESKNSNGDNDFLLINIDSLGNLIWQNRYGGSDDDEARSIQATSDGGYIIAGATKSTDGDITISYGGYDYWVVKIDSVGNIEWQKSYGGSNEDFANSIISVPSGYVIAGYSSSNNGQVSGNNGLKDFWIIKIDKTGNLLWQKSYGGSSYDVGYAITTTPDGDYVAAGFSGSSDGDVSVNYGSFDYWIIKIDSSGNLLWEKSWGGVNGDIAKSLTATADSGVVVVGSSVIPIIKLNKSGVVEWASDAFYSISSVNLDTDNNYLITYNPGTGSGYLGKVDTTGKAIWTKRVSSLIGGYIRLVEVFIIGKDSYLAIGTDADEIVAKMGGAIDQQFSAVKFCGTTTNDTVKICKGDSVFAGGAWQDTSGAYYDSVTAANGCDSVIVTHLFVQPDTFYYNLFICNGDSVFLEGNWQTISGVYYDTYTSIIGCDSNVVTNLTVHPDALTNISDKICSNDSIFLAGAWQKSAGIYYDSLSTIFGCDSIIATDLTVDSAYFYKGYDTICQGDSLYLGGAWQSTSGTYYDRFTTVDGCDSTIATQLVVKPEAFSQSFNICKGDSIFIEDAWQHNSGVFYDTLTATDGCDSIIISSLTVKSVDTTVTISDTSLTANAANADYLWFNCENQQNLAAGDSIFVPLISGSYAVIVTQNGCTDTSGCHYINITAVDEVEQVHVKIFPNPARDKIIFEINNKALYEIEVILTDVLGKTVIQQSINSGTFSVELKDLAPGIYFYQLKNRKGTLAMGKVMVE